MKNGGYGGAILIKSFKSLWHHQSWSLRITKIWESNDQNFLGANIDRNLKFSNYILRLAENKCTNQNLKIHECWPWDSFNDIFYWISVFILSLSMNALWKKSDNRINHLHKRAINSIYIDNASSFEKLLEKDNSVTFHGRNLRIDLDKQQIFLKQKRI